MHGYGLSVFRVLGGALLAGLAFSANASGALGVETRTYWGKPEGPWAKHRYKAPHVVGEAAVAARINDTLDLVRGNTDRFVVTRADNRVLALRLSGEGCGAYCEDFDEFYSFDARNGRLLSTHDLLRQAALKPLAIRLGKAKFAAYVRAMKRAERALAAARRKPQTRKVLEEIEFLEGRVAMSQACAGPGQGEPPALPDVASMEEDFPGYSILLTRTGVAFIHERCSNHASRALDDVGAFSVVILYAEMRPFLSRYGVALLLGGPPASPPPGIFGQTLQGWIGDSMPVSVRLLLEGERAVSGVYFYNKFRKPIELQGTLDGDVIELHEGGAEDGEGARIHLRVKGKTLSGHWEGKTRYPVSLHCCPETP